MIMKKRRRLVAWVLVFVLLVTTIVMDVPGRLFAEETTEAVEEEQSVSDTESSESPAVQPEDTEAASSEAISTEAATEQPAEDTEAATEQPAADTEADPEVSEEAVDKASESTDTQEAVPSSTEGKEDREKEDTPEAGGMEGPSRDRAERSEQEELEISRYEAASASDDEYKEGRVEITSVKMTINGVDWDQVDTVHNGDRLKISFDWKLDNTDFTTSKFVVDIGKMANNIGILDLAETTLLKGSTPIGIVRVENRSIYLEIRDPNFLSNESDRSGGGTIDGEINITGNPEQGDKVAIGIDGFTKDFKYDDNKPASAMGLWKSSEGSISYDNGKWYQTFKVSMQAWNGMVTDINMTDTLGGGLKNISDITVTESSVNGVNVNDTFANIAALNNKVSAMNKNEKITFSYKVEVDEAVFQNENAKYTDSYKNTFAVNYKNSKNDTPTVSSSSGVSVNLPGVSKTGVLDATTKKVTWTVTIDLRDYAKSGKSFNDFIASITDTPGEGLTAAASLSEGDFRETPTGSGIYQATYETTVIDEKLDSPNQEKLENTVKVTSDMGYEYSATGSVTTPGHEWKVEKDNGVFDENSGTISWTVNVTGIPKGAVDFELVEYLNPDWHAGNITGGKHKLQSVDVNGTTVMENGAVVPNDRVDTCVPEETDWNRVYTLKFKDTFFASEGKDLWITYTTKVDETDYNSHEYFWDNKAEVTFKHNNITTTHSDTGYAKNPVPKQPLSKSGKPVEGEDQIAYTLDVNLDYIENLQAGRTITIDDKLPENMQLVTDSLQASCFGKVWGNGFSYAEGEKVSVIASGSEGKVTFQITVTETLLETQKEFHKQYGNPDDNSTSMFYVRLTYKTKVVNREEFAKQGTTVFRNEACIEGGDPVSAEVSLTPEKAVTKAGKYPVDVEKTTTDSSGKEYKYTEKMAEYTIDVNPNGFELGRDGKFTAKDVLGSALNYDLTSVKVTDVDSSTVLALGDYTFSYNFQENSLTFVLPDKKHLRISYNASCNLETGGKMDASNTTNTFQIMGQSSTAMKDETFFNTVKVSSEFWAESGDAAITLFKFWTDEEGRLQALKGATFALYKADYVKEENKITLGKAVGQPFTITADTGNIMIRNLAYDQPYALVETKAPEGFVKGETYYFVITGSSGVTLPESLGVRSFNSGEVLNYENKEKTVNSGSLKITKTIEGSVTREEAEGALKFQVRQTKDSSGAAKQKQIGEYTLKDFAYNAADQQWILTLNDLEPGTYEVEETVYDIDGKVTAAVKYSKDAGTTWSTGDKDTVADVEVASDTTTSLIYKDTYTATPVTYIAKRVLGKAERLAGAVLQVLDAGGNEVARWTTSAEEDKKFEIGTGASMLKAGVEYTLTEISAPKGYSTAANPVKFQVDADGKVTINYKGGTYATGEGITLVLSDKPLELKLRKVSDGTPAVNLGGAVFELKQGDNLLTTVTSSSTGAVAMDASLLQADKTTVYTLSETKAPASCEKLTEDIQFTVFPGGKIELKNQPQGVTLQDSGITLQIVNKELVTVSGKKTWEDENNRDGMRPESIIVQLQQRKKGVARWEDVQGKQVTLTDAKLEYTFSELPKRAGDGTEYEYQVIEKKDTSSTKGDFDVYDKKGGKKSDNYNLTNTYVAQRINVSVTKNWVDNNNQDNLRQDIYVQLYKNGEPLGERYLLKLDGSTGWTHVWKNLVKYENGAKVVYTVDEVDAQGNEIVPAGYTKSITSNTTTDSGTETQRFQITNTHEPIKTSVSVTKDWDDNNNQDGTRPANVTVKLYADNVDTGKSVTLNEKNHWTAKWDNLDAYKDGKAIKYSVVEASVPDYTVSYTPSEFAYTKDNTEGAFTVTNTHTLGKTAYTVKKVWEDGNNRDNKRPQSITVQLYADNIAVADGTVTLNEANNWSYTWNDLNAKDNGTTIVYSVMELGAGNTAIVEGGSLGVYKVSYDATVAGLTTITNAYTPETVNLEVKKVWSGTGSHPDQVTVSLYADGKIVTEKDKVLNNVNGWEEKWVGLPKYAAGNPNPIKYTVKELEVPEGWSVSYNSDIANNKITITNAKATTQLAVTKVWDDSNNKAGKRPAAIGIQLLKREGGAYEPYPAENTPVYLDEVTGWRYTWTNLPDGTYTVEELGTDALLALNYNTKNQGAPEIKKTRINGIDTVVVTNSYEGTELKVKKTWDDSNNQDGKRPASVKVWLYENDVKTDKSLTLNEANGWEGFFTDLPVYKDGKQIKYAVGEEQVPEYTPGYNPQQYYAQKDMTGSLEISNSYTPGKTSWTVNKLWDDMENQDGIRSPSIDVQLYKNGVAEGGPVTLNESNNWTYTWKQLDAKAEGQDIQYTVDEVSVPAGYEKKVVNDKATGITTITNTHKPSAPGKLVITKTIEGDITKEEAEGALTFTVTAPDGSKKTYTLKDFTYDEASKKYVLVLDNLTEGSYTVEETTCDVEGRKCSVSYSVDGAPAQAGNQAVTEVKDNTEVTVDFKNVYEGKKTQLMITKRIQGDVTREEAEGALTFQVKNNATGQTDTYTLKQFTYDPATGLYTLTLDVVPGGYTVTETTKDVDGYQCSVTYSIDGGTPAAGDSASVTVAEGGSVKIAFEDNYTATDTKSVTEEQTTEEQDTGEDTEDEDTEEDTTEDGSDSEHKPKTGDDSSPLAAGAVMILAFGAMTFLYSEKKKH